MKIIFVILSFVVLSGVVLAKPVANRNNKLLDALLALQQGEESFEQDDNDGLVLEQEDEEDGAGLEQGAINLTKREKNMLLSKLQGLKRRANTKAEAQWWRKVLHFIGHVGRIW